MAQERVPIRDTQESMQQAAVAEVAFRVLRHALHRVPRVGRKGAPHECALGDDCNEPSQARFMASILKHSLGNCKV